MPRLAQLSVDDAEQAMSALEAGNTIQEIAASWDVTPAAIRHAIARHPSSINLQALKTSLSDHLANCLDDPTTPPELYAWRADINFQSLRRQAWSEGKKLPCNTNMQRKAFWSKTLADGGFNPRHVTAWCAAHNLPLDQVAHWFHRLTNPQHVLLWGYPDLLLVNDPRFLDVYRWADDRTDRFVLGYGKLAMRVAPRVASEAARLATPYSM